MTEAKKLEAEARLALDVALAEFQAAKRKVATARAELRMARALVKTEAQAARSRWMQAGAKGRS